MINFTKRLFTEAVQSFPTAANAPNPGQAEVELGRDQTQVTHFQWTIKVFGLTSQLNYLLTKD